MSNPEENKQSIYIDRDGVQMSPYSVIEVNQYLDEGRLMPGDVAWTEGMDGWQPICSVPGIKPPLATSPAPPPPVPPGKPPPPSSAPPPPPEAPHVGEKPVRVSDRDHQIIEAAIREQINKPTGELSPQDLGQVRELDLDDTLITDLTLLANLRGLKKLHLMRNRIVDLSPLAGLTSLKKLELEKNLNLTYAEVEKLKKALPKCKINHGNDPLLALIYAFFFTALVAGIVVGAFIAFWPQTDPLNELTQEGKDFFNSGIKEIVGILGPLLAWGSYRMFSRRMHAKEVISPEDFPDPNLKPHRADRILIFGIVGLFFWPLSIAAWVMGKKDLRAMDQGIMDPSGRRRTNAGRLFGKVPNVMIIGGLLLAVGLLFFATDKGEGEDSGGGESSRNNLTGGVQVTSVKIQLERTLPFLADEFVTNFYVTGNVKNTSSETLEYVELKFDLYNSLGEKVGKAEDRRYEELGPGSTWDFKAFCQPNGVLGLKSPENVHRADLTKVIVR